jgi:predicted enzyme related to lactoylglutathione lyase
MSLIGQLPLAAIRLTCKDIEGSKRFYRDVVGLKPIEEIGDNTDEKKPRKQQHSRSEADGDGSKDVHFDLGNIRLTLSPMESSPAAKFSSSDSAKLSSSPPASSNGCNGQFVFVVENAIDAVYADLAKRGVKFKSKKVYEDSSGKAAWFSDPDGNVIYLWQPPHRSSKNFKDVESVVRHYELVSRALADLRESEDVLLPPDGDEEGRW